MRTLLAALLFALAACRSAETVDATAPAELPLVRYYVIADT